MTTITIEKPASAKVLFAGKTHVTAGPNGAAWSACYIGAIELAAAQKKVKLPAHPEVDAEIDLNKAGNSFFLSARLNVSLPGVDRAVAQELIEAAHGICPYSKATHGNIDVVTTLL